MVELEDTLQSGQSRADGPISEEPTLPADSAPPIGGDFAELSEVPRDNYEIGDEIARGGMGRIVAARDRRAGRPIVLKEVRADLLKLLDDRDRRALVRRFKREAMLTARLQHPSVVPVYEIGRFGDTPFIAMKRVDGTPLLDLLEAAESLGDRLALLPRVIAVAEAIAYAHAEGVVHRDLKPANILVGAYGETVVIDWGLAKLAGERDDDSLTGAAPVPGDVETVAGAIFGTPAYMPPEQAAGEPVGPAADVYAIGAILYHLLAGRAPYSGGHRDPGALVDRVREEPPAPIRELESDAPADLVSLVDKAMARDPDERYASAGELASELRSFQRGQLVEVHDYSTWELVSRWIARRRALVITALTLTIAGAAATSWFVFQTIAARDQARREEARAETQLRAAMETTYERGKRELIVDRRRAIDSLATAYRHLDDPLLARELGEALLGLEGYLGEIDRDEAIEEVVLSPDGRWAAATSNRKVEVIDLETRAVAYELVGSSPRFADEGRYLVASDDGGAVIRAAATGERLGNIEVPLVSQASLVVNRHADLAFVIGKDDRDRGTIYSLRERRPLFHFDINTVYIGAVRISANGQRILIGQPITMVFSREGERLYQGGAFRFGAITALSADGERFAITEEPGVAIRASDGGEVLARIPSVGQKVDDLFFSADGERLLVTTRGVTCVWSLKTLDRMGCHTTLDPGRQVAFSKNFERVASARADGAIELWEGETGRVRAVLAAHSDGAPGVAISTDGELVVTGGLDGAVRLWRGDTDTLTAGIEHERGYSALSNHSDMIVLSGPDHLAIWDPDRPETPLGVIESEGAGGKYAAVSAGAEVAVWAGYGWEPLTGKRLGAIDNFDNLHVFAVDAAGEVVVGCGTDGFVYAHEPRTGALRWKIDLGDAVELGSSSRASLVLCSPIFVPGDRRVIVRIGGIDLVLDGETGRLLQRLDHSKSGRSLNYAAAFYGDDRYAAGDGMQIFLWDLGTGELLDSFKGVARGLTTHPDGQRLLLPLAEANFIYDPRTGERRRLASDSTPRGGAAFSPDGTMIAIGAFADQIEIYDVASGRLIARRWPGGATQRVGFSRGGRLVVTGRERTLIWELPVERRDPDEVDRVVRRGLGREP